MKLEDLSVGAIIMRADRKDNLAHTGEMWLVTRFVNVKAKFEAVCLHSLNPNKIGETGSILFDELPNYELITAFCIQPSIDNLFLWHKPSEPEKDLYIRWTFGKKTSLGKVGDKTPYKLENGRNLFVGDIVKISKAGEEYCGCTVVRDKRCGYIIMGIASSCNDRTGIIDGWNVSLESGFRNRHKGNIAHAGYGNFEIEVVDFLPEEKE
jgi:hypothetical protein